MRRWQWWRGADHRIDLRGPGRAAAGVHHPLAGITHDVCANSIAMFLGGAATAFFAVIYVVIILGNGVRFGAPYMGYASLLSLMGFGAIHLSSPYWEANNPLSINVVLVLTAVPAHMYPLIRSRQYAREELERRATHDSLPPAISPDLDGIGIRRTGPHLPQTP